MADGTYQPKTYRKDGGDTLIIASGGVVDVESGGAFKLAGTALTATAAEINRLAAATPGVAAANVANVADQGIGIELVLRVDVADAASQNIDITMPYKVRVVNVMGLKNGGAGGAANTVQVQNVTDAITDAMSLNINDNAIYTAATIDDAYHEVASGAKLRIATTKLGGNCAFRMSIRMVRVA